MIRRSTWFRLMIAAGVIVVGVSATTIVSAFASGDLVSGFVASAALVAASSVAVVLSLGALLRHRYGPAGREALELHRELEISTAKLRGETVISLGGEVVALYFPPDQPDVIVRVCADRLDDLHGVVTGDRFIVTPYRRLVLWRGLGANYRLDEDGDMLVDDAELQGRVNVFTAFRFALRTGAGVVSLEQMQELVAQLNTARPYETYL